MTEEPTLPNPGPIAPPLPIVDGLTTALGIVKYAGLVACLLGLIIAGAMMAIAHRRGEGMEHGKGIALAIGGAIIITGSSWLIDMFV